MNGNKTPVFIALLVLLVVGAWFALNLAGKPNTVGQTVPPGDQAPPAQGVSLTSALTRSDNGEGGVIAAATMVTAKFVELSPDAKAAGAEKLDLKKHRWFLLSLNTHQVDMSSLDIPGMVFLREGGSETKADADWVSVDESSGHHISGFVGFPPEGKWDQSSGSIELVIRQLADVPVRTLRWELPIEYSGPR